MKKILRKIKPILKLYHFLFAFLGACFYRFPSRKVKVFAVTGTNGKTTTVNIVADVFKEAGYKVGAISSSKFEINGKEEPNLFKMTMPGRAVVQKLIRKAVNEKCSIVVLEVTSEGIKQYRHRFINFDTVCFTNLTPEHIESHGSFENYRNEKGKLFRACKKNHVINIDDKNADYFLSFDAERKILFTVKNKEAIEKDNQELLSASNILSKEDGVSFKIKDDDFFLKLKGKFNVCNALVAIALAKKEGVETLVVERALKNISNVPGRMEEVVSTPFKVIIDYAVTPDALEGLYKELRESFRPSKIIAVFGACGGGRDRWKRPILGGIAEKYVDKIILTNEDPYDEDEEKIISDIEKGIKAKSKVEKIIDREKAIFRAIEIAGKNDIVVVTGKGNEPWMCLKGGKKVKWSEKEIVLKSIKKYN